MEVNTGCSIDPGDLVIDLVVIGQYADADLE
jgi:hypothetical protein